MDLIIKNKVIVADIIDILKQVKKELTNGKLHDIQNKGKNILITCPFHKNGHERKPACQVYADRDGDLTYGSFHCFSCGEKGSLSHLIEGCFDKQVGFGDEWLCDRFGDTLSVRYSTLPAINLEAKKVKYLDENILDKYKYFHPYMFKRKLTEDIIRKFSIGYDKETDCIVFPVWDHKDNLVMLTRRSVNTKFFNIPEDIDKPVYLLNFILKENIKHVYVVESQINALTCWTYGYPAVALFGTGSDYQYKILNKSGINHFILCFDGDEAGYKGIKRFLKNINKDKIVDIKKMIIDKDVNDLSKEQFDNLPIINSYEWLKMNK